MLLLRLATNLHQVTPDRPLPWPTEIQLLEDAGEPLVRRLDEDLVEVYERVPGNDDWYITADFYVGADRLELVALAVRPTSRATWPPPGVPLTTPVLRAVRVQSLYQTLRSWLSIADEIGLDISSDAAEYRKKPRPGPAGRPDAWYARLAAVYAELSERSSSPTVKLAQRYRISHSRARDLIHEARSRGMLTKTKQGQQGGYLTTKARVLLTEVQDESKKRGS